MTVRSFSGSSYSFRPRAVDSGLEAPRLERLMSLGGF